MYNHLVTIVRKGRASNASKEIEMELKSNYAKLCGKHNGRNNSGDGNSSNSNENDYDDLEACGGFAGETSTVENNYGPNNDHSVDEHCIRLVPV